MRKIIIGFVFAMFLLSLASAFDEGEKLTQAQVDAMTKEDILSLNLKCRLDDETSPHWTFHRGDANNEMGWYYVRWLSCLDLEKLPNKRYIVTRKQFEVHYKTYDYMGCILTTAPVDCNVKFNAILQSMYDNNVLIIRQGILSQKTLTASAMDDIPFIFKLRL